MYRMVTMAEQLLSESEIARRLDVRRQYICQLARRDDFPPPREAMRWDLDDIRNWLRRRYLRARPGAVVCSACGADLSS
jgi:predicted DNA-binding transcriptional regulator AlpA